MESKGKLLGKTLRELEEAAVQCGLKAFVGRQLADWLYVKRVRSWDRMVNISKAARAKLSEVYELGISAPIQCITSADGTKKYLFSVECLIGDRVEKSVIEAVMIPESERKTLCVSSQAGCKMGCHFCMTGRQGFHGNLSSADILNQFLSIDEAAELSNAVFMGMGEPFDNYEAVSQTLEVLTAEWGFAWSPKRITVSTIGVLPMLRRFLNEKRCHIAISLHNPFPDQRAELMPIQKAYDIREVIKLLESYDFSGQRRVSFEYTMFAGYNDDKRHADALSRLLRNLECRVNLIRFHSIPNFPYKTASDISMTTFRDRVNNNGIICTIRASRGEDIMAACGLLAGQHSACSQ